MSVGTMTIGKRLTQLRESRGWTVMQAHIRTGVSAAHISRIENGKRTPSPSVLKKLALGYGCDYEELMSAAGWLDQPTNESVQEDRAPSVSEEIARLVEQLPHERQLWWRNHLLLDLRQGNFDTALAVSA